MSVTMPGSMGSLGALSNSRFTSALPSPNNNTVTAWELSGEVPEIIAPIIYALPIQMLAYYTAVFMGTDVDQPRNLAKSVTVE